MSLRTRRSVRRVHATRPVPPCPSPSPKAPRSACTCPRPATPRRVASRALLPAATPPHAHFPPPPAPSPTAPRPDPHLHAPRPRRGVQRRPAVLRGRLLVGPSPQQRVDQLHAVLLGSHEQGGLAVGALGRGEERREVGGSTTCKRLECVTCMDRRQGQPDVKIKRTPEPLLHFATQ